MSTNPLEHAAALGAPILAPYWPMVRLLDHRIDLCGIEKFFRIDVQGLMC
jgi:hypothetical protein